jgi:hypothetical protein
VHELAGCSVQAPSRLGDQVGCKDGNMKKSLSARWATIAALAIIGILLWHAVRLFRSHRWLIAGDFHMYYVSDVVLLICSVLLIFSAMLWSNAGHARTSSAAMVAGSLFLGLVLTDQYILRFRYDTSGPADFLVTHLNWWRTFVKNNSLGYWEREIPDGEKAPLMITATGNSFTWGQGVKGMQYQFTAVLQTEFREHGLQATVLNYTPGPAAAAIESMRKVHPDVVLLCRTLMDIPVVEYLDSRKLRVNDDRTKLSMRSSWQSLTFFNPTLNFVTWKLIAPQRYQLFALAYFVNATLAYSDPATLAQNTESIRQTAEQVRAIGAQPLYVLLPFPHLWYYFMPAVREKAITNVRNSVADAGISLIDLTPIENEVSMKEFEVDPMDSHPNERMHALIAHRLYDGLMPLLTKMQLPKQ